MAQRDFSQVPGITSDPVTAALFLTNSSVDQYHDEVCHDQLQAYDLWRQRGPPAWERVGALVSE